MTLKQFLYDRLLQPKIFKAYKKYSCLSTMSNDELNLYRLKKIQDLVEYAYKYVPFYRNLWERYNLDWRITSLKEFENYPIVEKRDIKQAIQDKTIFSKEFKDTPNLVWQHTTWSTWSPLEFPFTVLEETDKNGCSRMFENICTGRSFDDRKVKVWRGKYETSFLERLRETLTNTYNLCIYDPQNVKETFLNEKRLQVLSKKLIDSNPKYIEAFPSALAEIARFIKKNDLKINFNVKWIITWAEQLYENDKKMMEDVFDTTVLDRYGGTEASLVAIQCPSLSKQGLYHVNELRIYLESVLDGQVVVDQMWQSVITDFERRYVPFIRYNIWDYVTISSSIINKCDYCGLSSRIISKIWGRFNDTIELSSWDKISPHLWQNILKKYHFIDSYQIIKKRWIDKIILRILWDKERGLERRMLEEELETLFTEVIFKVEFTDSIERNVWGKLSQIFIER